MLKKLFCKLGFHKLETVRGDDPRLAELEKKTKETGAMFERHWPWDVCKNCNEIFWVDI